MLGWARAGDLSPDGQSDLTGDSVQRCLDGRNKEEHRFYLPGMGKANKRKRAVFRWAVAVGLLASALIAIFIYIPIESVCGDSFHSRAGPKSLDSVENPANLTG